MDLAPRCDQCGYSHPPVPRGEKCPLAKPVSKETGEVIDLQKFLATMKIVLETQIEARKIKNINKFTGELIVHLTKFCESYKEI